MKFFRWFKRPTKTAEEPLSVVKSEPAKTMPQAARIGQIKIGEPLLRAEDDALIQGRGQYVDDIDIGPALQVTFVRSTLAAGKIDHINIEDA